MAKPSVTTVLLVRHGATTTTGSILPGRAPGLHLSERGRAQAQRAAENVASLTNAPVALYVSPLERTRETAAPFSGALGLKARVSRGLLECDFGDWTGKTLASLRRRSEWRTVQHAPSAFRFPNGESFAEMQRRIWVTIEDLAARHRGQTILCVSHADPIKAAVTYAQGVPLDLFQRTVISPGSISALSISDGAPTVLCVNHTGHFGEFS